MQQLARWQAPTWTEYSVLTAVGSCFKTQYESFWKMLMIQTTSGDN